MSSATQIDLAIPDGGFGGRVPSPASVPDATGFGGGTQLTDEEILGITPIEAPETSRGASPRSAATRNLSSIDREGADPTERDSSGENRPRNDNEKLNAAGRADSGTMPAWMQSLTADPSHGAEAQQLWQEHQAYQEYRAAFSSPEEARAFKEASQSVDRIDAAIFSGDARAQSEVVAELARANPAAFRTMFAEAAKVLAGMGVTVTPAGVVGPTLRTNREELIG